MTQSESETQLKGVVSTKSSYFSSSVAKLGSAAIGITKFIVEFLSTQKKS